MMMMTMMMIMMIRGSKVAILRWAKGAAYTLVIPGFHRASLLSVTFINQLMHSIITVVDVKIYVI
jgi:hypothetical protein